MSAQRALARLFSSRSVVDVLESRGMVAWHGPRDDIASSEGAFVNDR